MRWTDLFPIGLGILIPVLCRVQEDSQPNSYGILSSLLLVLAVVAGIFTLVRAVRHKKMNREWSLFIIVLVVSCIAAVYHLMG